MCVRPRLTGSEVESNRGTEAKGKKCEVKDELNMKATKKMSYVI